jgi:hypothetical protein
MFCELYRELVPVIKDPPGDQALLLPLNDAVQLREAFESAVVLASVGVDPAEVKAVFEASGATSIETASERKSTAESALSALIGDPARSIDLLTETLSGLAADPQKREEAKERALDGIVNDIGRSREAFARVQPSDIIGERGAITFLEAVCVILEDLGGDALANHYFNLLGRFLDKFSLRYDLRRPCTLCPTLPGVFASLMRDLGVVTSRDAHLDSLRRDFDEAIRDLRIDCSDGRIRNCIQKQVILLEALGQSYPGVTENTLGAICGQVGTWPHAKVQEAITNLYKFTNSYPGIRHAGKRVIDMRDLVAVSILLAGFTPYLCDQLNADVVYRGL